MAISLAKGLEDNNVIATYKHFPGHGDTDVDSHIDLPVSNKTLQELENEELIPFKSAIENNAKIIMIGHIALPEITGDDTPASLSKVIITDILKNQMGYKGLVITDALNMSALTKNYSYEEIYIKAIDAGVDLLLMPNSSKEAVEYIKNSVSEERIDESVRKILTFKYTYLTGVNNLDITYLGGEEHKQIIDQITH
jgi:beta-N-acetylhexosaminidase